MSSARSACSDSGSARFACSDIVSVALLLSASESAAAPAAPILLLRRLQRGEEGQGCSWRDRAAGTEQGARNLLQRRQRRVVAVPFRHFIFCHDLQM
jgi:hypothetical protein